jgi:hypothetical protein
MISSEVQRTLVKSPPELWAELSDPAALARHLGELGDIRITRVEPEKLVEWEAEGTTGTVAIKPSGWGTKVTLTVERELPMGESSDPTEDTDEPALDDASAETSGPQDDLQAKTSTPTAADSTGVELDAWANQEAEQDQPAITAAERFAHDDPAPLLGTRLGSDVDPGTTTETISVPAVGEAEPPPTPAATASESRSDERAPHLDEQPAEPRRGFLARLFGRRRGKAEVPEPPVAAAPEPTAPVIESASLAETAPIPEPDVAQTNAIASIEPDEAQVTVEPEPAHTSPSMGENVPTHAVAPTPNEAVAEVTSIASTEEAVEETAPSADLAAELREAEEASTEEVRAVLTAVLDRLGAAHHRPFSRS